jgi:hypothetical protein
MFRLIFGAVWVAGLLHLDPSALASPMNSLTLYLYRSPVVLDWSSPGSLTRTTLLSGTKDLLRGQENIALGHVTIKLDCEDGTSLHTAMTQADPMEAVRQLTREGLGLGILFHRFEGRLENREEIERRLERNRNVRFLKLALSGATCARLTEYARQFESQGHSRYYGLPLRPRKGEGAGCSAFGMSFLEIAGALETSPLREAAARWSRTLNVPKSMMGKPERGVPLAGLALKPARWPLQASDRTTPLFFWEPNRMYDWVGEQILMGAESPWKMVREGNHQGLSLDLISLPTPNEPFFE